MVKNMLGKSRQDTFARFAEMPVAAVSLTTGASYDMSSL
jgi:hypothetical protein